MQAPADPGWGTVMRAMLWTFVPGGFLLRRRRRRVAQTNGLLSLRALFVAFPAAVVNIGVVVLVLDRAGVIGGVDAPAGLVAAVMAAVGVAGITGALWPKPLDCADDDRLVGSYVTRFFIRLAFAEAPALVAFAAFIATGHAAVYLVGAAASAVAFLFAAPTARNLARDEERLRLAGCSRSITAILLRGEDDA